MAQVLLFELHKAHAGKRNTHFLVKDEKTRGVSETYKKKGGALNGIDSVWRHKNDRKNFELKQATNDEHYFVQKAGNGRIILTGIPRKTVEEVEDDIAAIQGMKDKVTVAI